MSKWDAIFLARHLAGRDKLNLAHHQMSVRVVTVQLERLCKSVQGEKEGKEQVKAIQKAFKFLTRHETFEAVYKNEGEDHWMTDTVMGEDPKQKFVVSFDTNMLDEVQLDALGGYITDDEILNRCCQVVKWVAFVRENSPAKQLHCFIVTLGPRRAIVFSRFLIVNYNIELSNSGAALCHSRSINSAWSWLRTVTRHGNGSTLDGKKKFVLSSTSSFPSYSQQRHM
jgi:hypothetical protein